MHYVGKERTEISVCPDEYQRVADSVDIQKAFDYMEKEFHLSKVFRKQFKAYLAKCPRERTEAEAFVRFGKEFFEEALNVIIQRKHSVVLIFGYILKDKLAERKKEYDANKRFYRSDEWKK